jgi:hypothetical protein
MDLVADPKGRSTNYLVYTGSGDGIAVIAAAKRGFALSKGYEINPFLCAYPFIRKIRIFVDFFFWNL